MVLIHILRTRTSQRNLEPWLALRRSGQRLEPLRHIVTRPVGGEIRHQRRDGHIAGRDGGEVGVIAIIDASNLERNLYLVTQMMEMEVPLVRESTDAAHPPAEQEAPPGRA